MTNQPKTGSGRPYNLRHIRRILLFLLIVGYFTACTPEETPSPTITRNDYIGKWNCTEESISFGGIQKYQVEIKPDSASNGILLFNFHNLGPSTAARATVNSDVVAIAQQNYEGNGLVGSGVLLNNQTIHLDYTVNDGIKVDTVSADYVKL